MIREFLQRLRLKLGVPVLGRSFALLVALAAYVPLRAQLDPTSISISPSPILVVPGSNITVTGTVLNRFGTGSVDFPLPYAYQWSKNSVPISGATDNKLTLINVQPSATGDAYSLSFKMGSLSLTSAPASVVVSNPQPPPVITAQPQSLTVVEGSSATLSVSVTGTGPFFYQWTVGASYVDGATGPVLTIPNVATRNAGPYAVIVGNYWGGVTSTVAMLTVVSPPTITRQPYSFDVTAGNTFGVSVEVAGTAPLTYQWKKDGVPIATTAALSITNSKASDSGNYTVTVSNSYGSVTSAPGVVVVNTPSPPVFTKQPSAQTVSLGASAAFTALASGFPTPNYQWKKDGATITSNQFPQFQHSPLGDILTLTSATASDQGFYICYAENTAQSQVIQVASNEVMLGIATPGVPPNIVKFDYPTSVVAGSSATFMVRAAAAGALTYQWRKDGSSIAGANSPSFTIASMTPSDGGAYAVVVTSPYGSVTSAVANISFLSVAPYFSTQPQSQTVAAGSAVTLSCTVVGVLPLSLQWFKDGVALPGKTQNSLTISSAGSSDAGSYAVRATNSAGTTTSNGATLTVAVAITSPSITSQLADQSAYVGNSASFSVIASGTAPLTYQWRKNGTPIAGATAATLSLANLQLSDSASYSVVVSNAAGSVTSSAATLSVSAAVAGVTPTITQQPASHTVTLGASPEPVHAGFSVTATGTAPLYYQWFKDGVALPGATISSLDLRTPLTSDAGNYSVVVSNSFGSVTSSTATLSFTSDGRPVTQSQPLDQTVTVGTSVTFNVIAGGSGPFTYLWRKNGSNISGATDSALTLSNVQAADAGYYSVIITNAAGSTTSSSASLIVTEAVIAPYFTSQAASATVAAGSSVSFSVTVVGTEPLSYQWRRDGTPLADATSKTLSLSNVQSADSGSYTVVVANSAGSITSSSATLTVTPAATAPSITGQPSNQSVKSGDSASFTVSVTGTGPLLYQWRFGATAIPGATSATLSLASVTSANAGVYSVVVTNFVGSVTSSSVTLTVAPTIAPSITTQPRSRVSDVGASVSFFFGVTGSPKPTFQWRKNSVPIPGAIADTLLLPGISAADAADYDCIATNSAGSVTSTTAHLTVNSSLAISASSLTGKLVAGGTANFSVTASGTLPISYQWFRGDSLIANANAAIFSLANLATADAADYKVLVSGPGGTRSATFKLVLGSTTTAPVITQQPLSTSVDLGGNVSFTAAASGTPVPTWQWRLNGTLIAGATNATYIVSAAQLLQAGAYTAVATNSAGSAVTSEAALEVKLSAATAASAGIYFGKLGSNGADGDFALQLRADGSGVLLINLPGAKSAILVTDFHLNADGSFSVTGAVLASPKSAGTQTAAAGEPIRAGASQQVSGSIASDGSVSGSVGGTTLAGTRTTGDVATAGFYAASATGGATGVVYTIVAPDGKALVVAQTAAGVEGGTGTVNPSTSSTAISVTTMSGTTLATTVNTTSGSVTTTADKGALAGTTFAGLRDDVQRTDRLANISTRGHAGAGADVMIAGFVVAGTDPRPVLIRAVGPMLATFGLTSALTDSRLELYRVSTKISESDNWGGEPAAAAVAAASTRVGAFALPTTGKDAVLLVTLDPGAYTAQVSGPDGATGVALVEVYDAGEGAASAATPRLVNISTRANVGLGEDVLIAGIVVTGNAPKRVLVRAVGPALAAFGLGGTLGDPVLKLISGQTTIATNDDWGSQSGEVAASDISTAAASVGAFALAPGSRDSSLIVTLMPGNYTAQISGKNDSTGVALVEIYELP